MYMCKKNYRYQCTCKVTTLSTFSGAHRQKNGWLLVLSTPIRGNKKDIPDTWVSLVSSEVAVDIIVPWKIAVAAQVIKKFVILNALVQSLFNELHYQYAYYIFVTSNLFVVWESERSCTMIHVRIGLGYQRVEVILLLRVLIPKTNKYFPTRQPLKNQSMKLLTACACRAYKDDWIKFDKFR